MVLEKLLPAYGYLAKQQQVYLSKQVGPPFSPYMTPLTTYFAYPDKPTEAQALHSSPSYDPLSEQVVQVYDAEILVIFEDDELGDSVLAHYL